MRPTRPRIDREPDARRPHPGAHLPAHPARLPVRPVSHADRSERRSGERSAGEPAAAPGEVRNLGGIAGQFDRPVVRRPGHRPGQAEPSSRSARVGVEGVVAIQRFAQPLDRSREPTSGPWSPASAIARFSATIGLGSMTGQLVVEGDDLRASRCRARRRRAGVHRADRGEDLVPARGRRRRGRPRSRRYAHEANALGDHAPVPGTHGPARPAGTSSPDAETRAAAPCFGEQPRGEQTDHLALVRHQGPGTSRVSRIASDGEVDDGSGRNPRPRRGSPR